MEQSGSVNTSARSTPILPLAAALVLVAFAIALRTSMLFSKLLPPGVDAAYYPMQARGILENGKLPYVEVPLIFWIDAAIAKALMALRGMDVDSATLLASRVVDAVSQPLAAIPLALLMLGFAGALGTGRDSRNPDDSGKGSESGRSPRFLPLAITVFVVGAIAILSPPILRMTGDFQKNSLGLVWMAASAWATYSALRTSSLIRWILTAVFLALAAITHIGAFGVTLALVGSTIGAYVVFKWNLRPKTLVLTGIGCLLGAAALWLLVYTVAPSKALGLAQGVTKMFTVGDRPQGRPAMSGDPARQGPPGPEFDRPGNRQGDRPPGPPGGFQNSALPLRAGAWALLLSFGGIAIWRARRVGTPELAVVTGAVFTAALITCPLIQGQYAERLSLMTPIPLAIIVGFLLLSWAESARRWLRIGAPMIGALAGIAILVAAFPMAMGGRGGPPPAFANNGGDRMRRPGPQGPGGPGGGGGGSVVADEAVPEFRSMRGIVPTDGSAVVIARHGLQWWAGYFLKTPVREEHATAEQLEKYDRVFILTEKSARGAMPERTGMDGGAGGVGGVGGVVGAGGNRPDDRSPRIPEQVRIPADSVPVFEGQHYRLFEVPRARHSGQEPGPA